jgi:seryl-tRNA synthetase
MVDIAFIRENQKLVENSTQAKGFKVDIERLLSVDKKRRAYIKEADDVRSKRNVLSDSLKGNKPTPDLIQQSKVLKADLQKIENEQKVLDKEFHELMIAVPNVIHESVKVGEGESANEIIRTVGDKPEFNFKVKDHETIGLERNLIDIESAAHTSGSGFYYLKNEAVLLEFALVNWLLQKYVNKGFTPVTTPVMVREHMMYATGFFPADKNEIYQVNPGEDNLFLVGTSEVTLAGLHMKKVLSENDLPKRYVGFSTCFRREAGSYGKDTKGIFRVHQFDKVEMYSFCLPNKSWEEHEYLLSIEEEILRELGLHYQVVNIGSGDLGAPAAKKYDCEVWIPSQAKFRELTSCSNTTDFQSRRGGIKYSSVKTGQLEYCHTLNGTAMASARTILAILENYQQEDGSIIIPEVLRPFMNHKEAI